MKNFFGTVLLLFVIGISCNTPPVQQVTPEAIGPVPTPQQLAWHDLEFYWFIHFGPNTFTNKEWGHGDEPADAFNPSALDCNQWAKIARQSGAKGIILTAKHHDGFCLWPSRYSKHTVRESKWKDGKGDVVKDLSEACKANGLLFGIYLSPWDRNHPDYGTPEYNDVYVNAMTEVTTQYGPLFEFWWDGANGEGPNGKKQVYDFSRFEKEIRKLAPDAVVFSDIGPDIRWVGNEKGIAGKTNWNLLDTAGFTRGAGGPPQDTLNRGNENGKNWIPAECDVSIRPGWFYHAEEDDKVKTSEQLFDLYLKSVGRGSSFLLNVPPDRRGLIHANDSAALVGFKKYRDESFADNRFKNISVRYTDAAGNPVTIHFDNGFNKDYIHTGGTENRITINPGNEETINCILLKEYIALGQSIKQFKCILKNKEETVQTIEGTTIGHKRILTFDATPVTSVEILIEDTKGNALISDIAAYRIPDQLVEK
ncbi:MAG: alpha-L-fucosidase [Chitinophagaceae bacterium]|nr:alpha-L-fucosidase [Chitinophagaceae bacterium]